MGQPHEYIRGGTAKLLTLFRPATGQVRATGVTNAPNVVLHPWLQKELVQVLAEVPEPPPIEDSEPPTPAHWATWLGHVPHVPLPPLRLILIWDNLARTLEYLDGHVVVRSRSDAAVHTAERILVEHGRIRPAHPV